MRTQASLRSFGSTRWALVIVAIASLLGSVSATAQPNVEATLNDALTNDADSDTVADPGDTIRYEADINNTGDADAEGAMFDLILDPNTTLVPGSLNVSPLALDDAYVVLQNGTLDVSDPGEGLFANDLEFLGDTFSLGTADSTSAEGSTVTVNANGTFTYSPPSGFSGEDTFTYTLIDTQNLASGPAVVTVTVNVCPVLQDDAITTAADAVASGSVFDDNGNGADTDPDGGTLEVIAVNGSDSDVGTEITLASGALLTLNSDGSFSYDPNGQFDTVGDGEDDTDSFTYTADDGTGLCAESATVTVTISGVNDCPVAEDDDATTDEDTILNGDVLADNGNGADSDTDTNDNLTIAAVNGNAGDVGTQITLASGALLTLNSDGTFAYDPNGQFEALDENDSDTDSFGYTLTDGTCEVTATVTLTITGVNDCPVAQADAVSTDEDTPLNGDVLADNGSGADSDVDTGDTLTVTEVNGNAGNVGAKITLASGALLTLNSDGTFSYDPNGQFEDLAAAGDTTDSFDYTVSDGDCPVSQTVTLTIGGVNDCPVAEADAVTTDEDTPLNGDVLADNGSGADSDVDTSDTLTITEVNGNAGDVGTEITLASGALLTLNSDGTFSYDPNGQFDDLAAAGDTTDSFDYTVSDGDCPVSETVTITIGGVNDCPIAQADAVSTDEDTPLNGDVLGDNGSGADSDVDTSDTLTITEVNGNAGDVGTEITLASGALLTVNSDGTFTYDPNGQFETLDDTETDSDSFTYTVSDGDCPQTQTVSITIDGVNDCPVANDDELSTDEDTPANGDVLADNGNGADSDVETGDTLSVASVNGNAGDVGVQVTLPSGALLTLNSDGTFAYDPNGAFESLDDTETDTDSFNYGLYDGDCEVTGTVTFTIDGANDCPVTEADAVTTDEDTATNGDVLADNGSGADTDPDTSDTLSIASVNGNSGDVGVQITLSSGALLTLNSDGTFAYDPNGQFEDLADGANDSDSFTYTVSDGDCPQTQTVSITITGVNDCPAAEADAAATDEDTATNGDVLADNGSGADSDPDTGDSLTVTAVNGSGGNVGSQITLSSGALLTVNSDGSYFYDPNGQFESLGSSDSAPDSFTYSVSDGDCSQDATVTLTINGVNDAPTAAAHGSTTVGNVELVVNEGSLTAAAAGTPAVTDTSFNLLDSASDPDTGASLSVVPASGSSTGGGTYQVYADGSFNYVPPTGAGSTTDTFTYQVTDGTTPSTAATVTITLGSVVWFIDNTDGGTGGTGTSVDPFLTPGDFSTVNGGGAGTPATGETVFLFEGSGAYDGTLTLLDNQTVLGEANGLTIDAINLVSAGIAPQIVTSVGNAVEVAIGNTLTGFNIGNRAGAAIAGNTFGTLTITAMNISGNGQALALQSGTLSATFGDLGSTSSAGRGIVLDTVGGSLTVTGNTSIVNATGAGIDIAGAPASATFDFGATTVSNTGAGDGILIGTSPSCTFTFDSLSVTTANGAGFSASSSGTLYIGDTTNVIDATGGPALVLDTMTLGGSGMTFATLSSASSTGDGINLTGIDGTAIFTVTGATTISNAASNGIEISTLSDVNTQIAFGNVTVTNTGDEGVKISGANNTANNPAISFGDVVVNLDVLTGDAFLVENSAADVQAANLTVNP